MILWCYYYFIEEKDQEFRMKLCLSVQECKLHAPEIELRLASTDRSIISEFVSAVADAGATPAVLVSGKKILK